MLRTGFPYRKLENESGHGKFMEHENLAKSHGILSKYVGFFFPEIKKLMPIFHCDAKYLASGVGVGQCPQPQNFALEIPTCWYILALPNAKICSAPTQNLKFALAPTPTPDASQWNIGGVGPSGVGAGVWHVHFFFFVLISFAFCSQRKPSFQWNMGLSIHSKSPHFLTFSAKCHKYNI